MTLIPTRPEHDGLDASDLDAQQLDTVGPDVGMSVALFQDRQGAAASDADGNWTTYTPTLPAQILNVEYAATQYLVRAIRNDRRYPGYSAGQLAQSVQISAFPDRYDGVRLQAMSLMERYCS